MKDMLQSRREFLKNTAKVATVATAFAVASPLMTGAKAEATVAAPAHPFEYKKLDPETVEKRAYASYFTKGGCCAGVFDGILGELAEEYGYPYNQVPVEIAKVGAAGFGQGSLCGSLGGGAMAIALLVPAADSSKLFAELCTWYRGASLPMYQPEFESVTTVANSVNCLDSVGNYMTETGLSMGDEKRKARCGGVTADVAKKTIEILNTYYNL